MEVYGVLESVTSELVDQALAWDFGAGNAVAVSFLMRSGKFALRSASGYRYITVEVDGASAKVYGSLATFGSQDTLLGTFPEGFLDLEKHHYVLIVDASAGVSADIRLYLDSVLVVNVVGSTDTNLTSFQIDGYAADALALSDIVFYDAATGYAGVLLPVPLEISGDGSVGAAWQKNPVSAPSYYDLVRDSSDMTYVQASLAAGGQDEIVFYHAGGEPGAMHKVVKVHGVWVGARGAAVNAAAGESPGIYIGVDVGGVRSLSAKRALGGSFEEKGGWFANNPSTGAEWKDMGDVDSASLVLIAEA